MNLMPYKTWPNTLKLAMRYQKATSSQSPNRCQPASEGKRKGQMTRPVLFKTNGKNDFHYSAVLTGVRQISMQVKCSITISCHGKKKKHI